MPLVTHPLCFPDSNSGNSQTPWDPLSADMMVQTNLVTVTRGLKAHSPSPHGSSVMGIYTAHEVGPR